MYALLLGAEVAILYFLGKYALWRLVNPQGLKGSLARSPYYMLVAPGIVAHESAHFLVCLLTQTRILKFRPFRPERDPVTGQVVRLGSVEFERPRLPFVRAAIGVAPLIVNPVLLLLTTAVLTPLHVSEILGFAVSPGLITDELGSFAVNSPSRFALWCWVAGSLALGSSLSASDRQGLVPVGLVVGLLAFLTYTRPLGLLGPEMIGKAETFVATFALPSAGEILASLAGLYALPAAVAAAVAAAAWATQR